MKHQDQQSRKPLITTPSVRAKGTERGTVVEGGVLSRGKAPLSNLGTTYLFLTLSASSDHFLVPPTGPNQQEARGHGSCVGKVLRGQPPRKQCRAENNREWIYGTDGEHPVQNLCWGIREGFSGQCIKGASLDALESQRF